MPSKLLLHIGVVLVMSAARALGAPIDNAPILPAPDHLSVHQAVQITLQDNPQLKQAVVSYLVARASLASARDLKTTTVSAGVNQASVGQGTSQTAATLGTQYTLNRRSGDQLSANITPVSSSSLASSVQLQYTKPLINKSGRTSDTNVRILSADYDLASQDNQLFVARQGAVEATVRAYFNAVRARDLIDVGQSALSSAQETVRMAQRMFDAGLVAEIEVSRAQIQLAQSENALVEQKRAYRDALDTLLLAMGLKVGQTIELIDPVPDTRETLDVNALVTEAEANRKELTVDQTAIDRQKLDLAVAGKDLKPSLDVVGSYTGAGIGLGGSASSFSTESYWATGLQYSLPIGSVSRKEREKTSALNLQQLNVNLESERQQIKNEVLSAARTVDAAAASVDIFQANLKVADENLKLARRMVEEGLTTNRDLLDAQVSVTQTKSSLLGAQIDYYLGLVDLHRALGRDIAKEMGS